MTQRRKMAALIGSRVGGGRVNWATAMLLCALALRSAVAQNVERMNVEKLLAERKETLAYFQDPHQSPYAAVAQRAFQGAPLVLGSAADCDVHLEEMRPRHARIAVQGDSFEVEALDKGTTVTVGGAPVREARVQPGSTFEVGRYTIFLSRISHQNSPAAALLVFDPRSPRLREGSPPRWFPPDPNLRIVGRLERDASPRDEVVLTTRGTTKRARRLGHFSFELGGRKHQLTALSLLVPGSTARGCRSSSATRLPGARRRRIGVGRYLEAEPIPGDPDRYVLDFNRAYNPTCAFSPYYSCPLPPRENVLQVPARAGEMNPGRH